MPSSFCLGDIFQDHAVLQREVAIPVWGAAAPGARIVITFAGYSAAITASQDGRWLLRLPPLSAGGPHELIASSDQAPHCTIELRDILIGEVWVGSGQSNMEWLLMQSDRSLSEAADADHPHIRLLTVGTEVASTRQSHVNGRWMVCTPDSIGSFSAVAGWFGRTLHVELGIPVGLIVNAWGGSRIEAWLSREALMLTAEGHAEIAVRDSFVFQHVAPAERTRFSGTDDWFRTRGPEDPINHGVVHGWHQQSTSVAGWPCMSLPTRWQEAGHDFNGIFWFRRTVPLPDAWQGRDLRLSLGSVDKHDDTYVNGHRVGGISWENRHSWHTLRVYEMPASLIGDSSEVTIAVRVRSHLYHGGFIGPASAMHLSLADTADSSESLPLDGEWAFQIEQNWGVVKVPSLNNAAPSGAHAPHALFDSCLYPIIPYAIRGFIWYQGEANVAHPKLYHRLMVALIEDWRRWWGQGDLPFIQVQLAGYESGKGEAWPRLRAAQAAAALLTATGLVTTIDVGDAKDIHPRHKKPVGLRLARWALSEVYARPGPPAGPLLRAVFPEGRRLRLAFHHAAGLHTNDNEPVGTLEIVGLDGHHLPAISAIEGETLLVWHPDIASPVHVRYAWVDFPVGANLCNALGLPAYPFDTAERNIA
ncbi:MAG: hypothetical protein K0R17_3380 [Rariglobus sp.]|jgi:sialate O-acetylesterase|nr:hypothetical protein [Rariglobus sp.]